MVTAQSCADAEYTDAGDERRHVLHVAEPVGVVLGRVLVGVMDPIDQDNLIQSVGETVNGLGKHRMGTCASPGDQFRHKICRKLVSETNLF